jgi:hypothetical protein
VGGSALHGGNGVPPLGPRRTHWRQEARLYAKPPDRMLRTGYVENRNGLIQPDRTEPHVYSNND